jgi:hypothetical protein
VRKGGIPEAALAEVRALIRALSRASA